MAATVTIERIEINKKDIEKVKKIFSVKDNSEAVMKAVDMAAGKIEMETIFEKFEALRSRRIMLKKLVDTNIFIDRFLNPVKRIPQDGP